MPTTPTKVARMACSVSDEAAFIKQQEILRDRCSNLLAENLDNSPDVIWKPDDGHGIQPTTEEDEAQLKLVLDVSFDKETKHPIFPPSNNRLSDELVYLATKFLNSRDRGRQYPYDFDSMGNINPRRVSSGPAPIIWAHGVPFFPVYKGYYILCGREHANCIGWLLNEKTKEIMQANPIWSVGAVVAPDSAVRLPHSITRQMTQHRPQGIELDANYRCKAWARDVVAAEHHLCAVLPNLGDEIEVCQLWSVWGYNVCCGPVKGGVNPTTIPKEFFAKHGIKDTDYASLAKPYGNHLLDGDGDADDEMDSDSEGEGEDTAAQSGEGASSSSQPTVAQTVSQMDVDMDIDSSGEISKQEKVQLPDQGPEQATEQATEKVPKEATEAPIKQDADKVTEQAPEQAIAPATENVPEEATEVPIKQDAEKVTEQVTEKVPKEVTEVWVKQDAEKVTEQVTEKVPKEVTEVWVKQDTEKVTEQAPEQAPEQDQKQITEKVPEEVTEVPMKQDTEEITKGPGASPSGHEDKQPAVPSESMDTE